MTSPTSPAELSPELTQIIEDSSGVDAASLTPESRIADLGITSLAMIEIAVRIEDTFNVRLDDPTVFSVGTIGDLAELVATQDPE
ncbi:Meromycolate extension acyl carrier protein [Corynebacterium atrinae]|uniref:acyl carrier protein n=1 Tax=Corynebacterium atrinae TaxID=1336740 RepID=UPI0025B2F928|nr:acyl carrier protein [Corynebacterium atrinae]WJY63904.1 Meromycolate extension acyl carrier protein [Corynebacterium atrinae]